MTATHCSSVRFFQILRISGFKPPVRRTSLWPKIPTVLLCLAGAAVADVSGDFTYLDNGTTVTITDYPTNATGAVVIPETILDPVSGLQDKVVGIGFEAFRDCAQITSVSIPFGVTSIGNNAFYNCVGLTSTSISSGVTGLTIGTYAFFSCQLLESMVLPYGVTSIGANAFYQCRGMESVSIPTSVTTIGVGAFYNCSGLKSVVLPSSITSISGAAFYSCSGLESVTIPSTVKSIGIDGFRYCSGLTSVALPSNLESLGARAFANCRGLHGISIPASVLSIGSDAFYICSSLTTISVAGANPNYSSSPDGVLFNKGKSTLIAYPAGKSGGYSVPAGVTSIGAKAFHTCERLVGVTFPEFLGSIGIDAFTSCSSLKYANFKGEAPPVFSNIFLLAASGFTVYYFNTATEFTTPTWTLFDYPAFSMGSGGTLIPEANWLLEQGLPANTDIQSDSNGDGVTLLMARALNLDPHRNLSGEMPQPVIAGNQMSLSYYAAAAGINYVVESSTNLVNWSSEGVTFYGPDTYRTATVNMSGPRRYMRLGVGN